MSVTIPKQLETPPRSTGNVQQDYPILIDWIYRAYQVISQSVAYINNQLEGGDIYLDVGNLPDPSTATTASAQETANQAFALASQANTAAETAQSEVDEAEATITTLSGNVTALGNRLDGFISGTVTISDANSSATVTFAEAQADTSYRVIIQAKSVSGSPASGAFTIRTKTYTTADFSFTIISAPGAGTSVTYEWQLVRNS